MNVSGWDIVRRKVKETECSTSMIQPTGRLESGGRGRVWVEEGRNIDNGERSHIILIIKDHRKPNEFYGRSNLRIFLHHSALYMQLAVAMFLSQESP